MPAAGKKRPRTTKKRAARKRAAPPVLVNALAEAAWDEADAALAEAMVEFRGLAAATGTVRRQDAMALLNQALVRAARKRGLTLFGAVGTRETYDPSRHDAGAVSGAKQIRIEAPGVMRGSQVLIKARVSLARARRA